MTEKTSDDAASVAGKVLSEADALMYLAQEIVNAAEVLARALEQYIKNAKAAAGSALTQKEDTSHD